MNKKDVLQHWYDEVWGKGELSVIQELMCPETLAEGVFTTFQIKADEFAELVQAGRSLLTDITTEITHCIEQGDWLAARLRISACRADTGDTVSFTSQVMLEFKDEKISQALNQLDYFSLFEQLGQLPPESLAVCLTGQRMTWA